LLRIMLEGRELKTAAGLASASTYRTTPPEMLRNLPEPGLQNLEQSNSSIVFGREFFLKVFRRLQQGKNPEVEIGQHFAALGNVPAPPLVGSLSYITGGKTYSLGAVHEFVKDGKQLAGDMVQDRLAAFAAAVPGKDGAIAARLLKDHPGFFDFDENRLPDWFLPAVGDMRDLAGRLGQRTAEMHMALSRDNDNPDFTPENTTPFYLRSLLQSLRNRAEHARILLKKHHSEFDAESEALYRDVVSHWDKISRQLSVLRQGLGGQRIRVHGDYHLGQVIFTGDDFRILDFEGEPRRPVSARRLKHPPLVDVAGMLRSFDYAIHIFCRAQTQTECSPALRDWMRVWELCVGRSFLKGYVDACRDTGFLPRSEAQVFYLVETFLLDKALYEVAYELASRPDWVSIPLKGVREILASLSCCKERATESGQ
jgi:maltose alpha-D-glucosyltransferase/alpha-amylase